MIFIFIIFLLFDFLLSYFIPLFNPVFVYLPLLFVSTVIVFLIYNLNNKKTKYYFYISIIYDFFFSNIHFVYILIFFVVYIEIIYIGKSIKNKTLLFLIGILTFIFLKYLIILFLYNYPISFFYTSILLNLTVNIIYGMVLSYFLGIKNKKH